MRRQRSGWLVAALLIGAAVPARADTKGEAALKQAFAKLGAARTFAADLTASVRLPNGRALTLRGTAKAMKPNFLRVELKGPGGQLFVADGKSYYTYATGQAAYLKQPLPSKPAEFLGAWEGEIDAFFGGAQNVSKVVATYGGSAKIGGVDCDVVKVVTRADRRTIVYTIGKADRLIRRATIQVPVQPGVLIEQTNLLTNIRLNAPLKPAAFQFKPPAGTREVVPGSQRRKVKPGVS